MKFKEDLNSGRAGYMKSRKDMWSCQRSVLVGWLLKENEERKGRDNADLSQLSDYAAEVFY